MNIDLPDTAKGVIIIKPYDTAILLLKIIEELCKANLNLKRENDRLLRNMNRELVSEYKKENHKDSKSPSYNDFAVDKLPIINKPESDWYYKDLIRYYKWRYGVTIKPINRHVKPEDHNGTAKRLRKITCPVCKAPAEYIYENNGAKGQLMCKVCKTRFTSRNSKGPDTGNHKLTLKCPYCNAVLKFYKERSDYTILRCNNDRCEYYLNNLKTQQEGKESHNKLRYSYRLIRQKGAGEGVVLKEKGAGVTGFSKNNIHIMALALTMRINYGLSVRKTQEALKTQYNIEISAQQVCNYCSSAAESLREFLLRYPYKKNHVFVADETYIKIRQKRAYVWFIMDAKSRAIVGFEVSLKRSLAPAIDVMGQAFASIKVLPKDFIFVADGFSVYPLAAAYFNEQHEFEQDISVTVVKGIKGDDKEEKNARQYKQMIERLNRTFKSFYRDSTGYPSLKSAESNVVLFVAYYNFIRPHSALNNKPPVEDKHLKHIDNQIDKWCVLLEMAGEWGLQ